ncbi:histidine--tRNA ligase [Pseudoclavibacter endophyticus]|uniref:Histidine--tRNA ligase n=1 Tax=Pseudoclavibacter endophyticus TaxID=1778590 RepID=A0A6H9WLB5_9MICO|nr:histidine--tRNA ligase [Pseudoclavibacter endophyticus]KAB1649616.1 histidine--tRNA ligase [Pseudoclavibacter endophyticus]GGA61193.1 histidine--tRNA ligase [Pseudoclavibacter endophyticus]
MAQQISPPRGMRDFLPADKRRRERVLGTIRAIYRAHGFDEIETPVVEDAARLHSGLGGDNEKLSFGVLRRGIGADDLAEAAAAADPQLLCDLGLRFDLTVPLARFYASHRAELPTVFRAVQIAPVWRAERPQKGRYRQFVQCDVDILGEPGELAEIELLTAGSAALAALGLHDCVIRINDRRLLTAVLAACGFAPGDQAQALISIDKLDKIGPAGVVAELAETAPGPAGHLAEVLAAWAPQLEGGIVAEREAMLAALPESVRDAEGVPDAVASIDVIAAAVRAGGGTIGIVYDPTLVRGMGYYTGTIFEVAHPQSGSSVGGGGRYDGMIGRFLGQDVPACGFSIGFERIVDLARLDDAAGARDVALLADKRLPAADLVRVKAAVLATGGHDRVRVERKPKNLRGLLASLETQGFSHVAHVRDEHVADPASLRFEPLGAPE